MFSFRLIAGVIFVSSSRSVCSMLAGFAFLPAMELGPVKVIAAATSTNAKIMKRTVALTIPNEFPDL